jgi:predicted dehydrogenase
LIPAPTHSLGIGLIGCGFIGRFHSTAIRDIIRRGLLDLRYAAVCDLDEPRARAFADITGAPLATTDARELIASPDVDVVYICIPTAGHRSLVLEAAARRKHIFCEKPLAATLPAVEEMLAAVETAGVRAGVGLILRHSPILTVLKSLTDDPSIGRLMTILFRDDQFFPIHGHYKSEWRKDRALVGAGTLLEHSIHDVDVLRWFAGDVTSVRGTVRNFAGHEGVEDLATAHIEFESGAQAQLVSVWHNVLARPSSRRVEIFYENAYFHVEHDFLGPITYQTHGESPIVLSEEDVRKRYLELAGVDDTTFGEPLRYSLEDYFFLHAVSNNRDPLPNFRTALEAHRVVDAIYRSAAAGAEYTRLS